MRYDGPTTYIHNLVEDEESAKAKKWAEQFNTYVVCPPVVVRLRSEALSLKIGGSISQMWHRCLFRS